MNETDINLIDKFLENELGEEELQIFKEKYKHDQEFTAEVKARSKIYISLEAASKISLDTMANNPGLRHFISSRENDKTAVNWGRSKTLLRIAAVLIPLIGLGGLIFPFVYQKPAAENLYNRFYIRPESQILSKGSSEEKPVNYAALLNRIDNIFKIQIDSLQSINDEKCYFYALYCMENYRFKEAIYIYNRITDSRENPYRPECKWNMGLCYLKTGDIGKAKQIFTDIADIKDHQYNKEALKLLRKLH